MKTLSPHSRLALVAGYFTIVLLPGLLIMLLPLLPRPAVAGMFLAYAFTLLPTYYLDHWLLGGHGFHSPATFALLAFVVAAMLWPLPLLSARPSVWRSVSWRWTILGYGILLLAYETLAAWQMTRSWGLFFG